MKLQNILNDIEQVDPEFYERTSERRDIFKNFGGIGKKLALTAVPFFFGSVLKKAYGQAPTSTVLDILNYALTLEYLEAKFYANGVAAGTALVPAGAPTAAIQTIANHEAAHVTFLKKAITSAGGTPVAEPAFDFTAKGTFTDTFTNYQTFLAIAQTFEDTGVRAYKGQAANLIGTGAVLTAALNIHSVEARHASHIRQMRKANGASVKPWITGKDSGIGSVVQASYDGEDNVTQAGITITGINGQNISVNAATECFDEPLTKDQVLAIVKPFLA